VAGRRDGNLCRKYNLNEFSFCVGGVWGCETTKDMWGLSGMQAGWASHRILLGQAATSSVVPFLWGRGDKIFLVKNGPETVGRTYLVR
jgi:hypothetical protein